MDFEDEYELSSKKTKYSDLLAEIKEIEDDSFQLPNTQTDSIISEPSVFVPSSLIPEKKKKKKKEDKEYTDKDADEWFNDMMNYSSTYVSKNGKSYEDLFESAGINGKKKKKKKKDKDKNKEVDYKKEFETEAALFRNLLRDQSAFTESLQKEYDYIKSSKASSRGVNKQLTDLIESITAARALSMQLVEKNVNIKKTIADLTLKQKKEMGALLGDNGDLTDFGAAYLKNMIAERQSIINMGSSDGTISDYTEDSMFDEISNILSEDESMQRPEEIDKYLKYENRNVSIYTCINKENTEDYDFIAKDEDGEIIDDYPLPIKTRLSINNSTNIATDTYGKKYNILWR